MRAVVLFALLAVALAAAPAPAPASRAVRAGAPAPAPVKEPGTSTKVRSGTRATPFSAF